jgi:hypothetical protein
MCLVAAKRMPDTYHSLSLAFGERCTQAGSWIAVATAPTAGHVHDHDGIPGSEYEKTPLICMMRGVAGYAPCCASCTKNPHKAGMSRRAYSLSLIFQNILSAGFGTLVALHGFLAHAPPGCRGFVGPVPSPLWIRVTLFSWWGECTRPACACQYWNQMRSVLAHSPFAVAHAATYGARTVVGAGVVRTESAHSH